MVETIWFPVDFPVKTDPDVRWTIVHRDFPGRFRDKDSAAARRQIRGKKGEVVVPGLQFLKNSGILGLWYYFYKEINR